jgi:hypothetical protein
MSPQAYEYLLVAAGLGINNKSWGFTIIKKQSHIVFIGGHRFSGSNGNGTDLLFEIDCKTIDLNAFILGVSAEKRVRGNFIRIVVWNENSPLVILMQRYCDGRMCTNPTRINGRIPDEDPLIHSSGNIMLIMVWRGRGWQR